MTTKQDDVTQADKNLRDWILRRDGDLMHLASHLDNLLSRHRIASTRQVEADKAELVEALGNEARLAFRIADEQNSDVVREAIHSMAHRLQALAKHRQSQENERG